MSLNDVIINKRSGGLGRRAPNGDMISGLLANGVAASGGAQLDTVYRLRSVQDALALKINAAYDTATILLYEHIAEIFRINPSCDLYLMLAAQNVTYANLLDPAEDYATKLLREANGDIRQLAVAFNPAVAVTDTTALVAAIAKAQSLAVSQYAAHMPVEILLEGKGFDPDTALPIRTRNAENITVMFGQALSVATTHPTYAAVGTLLGAVSKARVNENIGWVQNFNMYGGNLETAAIGGVPYHTLSQGTINTIHDNGGVFLRTHTGKAGIYFNDSHTATEITSDYAYIENNRTIHKAVRLIRQALLPRLNSPVLIDPETGKLSPEVVKSIETEGRRALEEMLKNQEVSAIDILVDPEQNILSTSELLVDFSLTPTGTSRQITASIGFVNPF